MILRQRTTKPSCSSVRTVTQTAARFWLPNPFEKTWPEYRWQWEKAALQPQPLNIRPGRFIPVDGKPMKLTNCTTTATFTDECVFTGTYHTAAGTIPWPMGTSSDT
jgi:hypothetical protein